MSESVNCAGLASKWLWGCGLEEAAFVDSLSQTIYTAVLQARAAERRRCIVECAEVAAAMREQGAHADAWGAAACANYLNKEPPFGFIGPPSSGPSIDDAKKMGRDRGIQDAAKALGIKVSPIPSQALEQLAALASKACCPGYGVMGRCCKAQSAAPAMPQSGTDQ